MYPLLKKYRSFLMEVAASNTRLRLHFSPLGLVTGSDVGSGSSGSSGSGSGSGTGGGLGLGLGVRLPVEMEMTMRCVSVHDYHYCPKNLESNS